MKLANKDLTVRQWVVAVVNGLGMVDWERKCNYVRIENGWVIFEDVDRNDPSKFLILDAFQESDVTRISWEYGKDEIKKYFMGEAAPSDTDEKKPTVEVAEPVDIAEAEKREKHERRK